MDDWGLDFLWIWMSREPKSPVPDVFLFSLEILYWYSCRTAPPPEETRADNLSRCLGRKGALYCHVTWQRQEGKMSEPGVDVEPLGLVSQHSKTLNLGQKHSETDRTSRVSDSSLSDLYLNFAIVVPSWLNFFSLLHICHRGRGINSEPWSYFYL